MDVEHAGEERGGQVACELEERGGAVLAGMEPELAEPLVELVRADRAAWLSSGEFFLAVEDAVAGR